MPDLELQLHLNPGQVLQYYRGAISMVQARSSTGQKVQFPASALQRHVRPDGVHGQFRLTFDERFKFVGLERLP